MTYIFLIIILILSVMIHEVAHGAMALHLGDPTAKMMGRLSLNPIKHLDPVGSIMIPLFLVIIQSSILIGWAKPVPINPANFKDQKYGNAKVSLAGPGVNIAIALIFGAASRILPLTTGAKERIFIDFIQDPFKLSSVSGSIEAIFYLFIFIIFINTLLAIFNLMPIPPLDGSHILFTFLPDSMNSLKITLQKYGFFILIFFIFVFLQFLFPLIVLIVTFILGVF